MRPRVLLLVLFNAVLLGVVGCTVSVIEAPVEIESVADGETAEAGMSEGEIALARATWHTGWFQAEVFKMLLEKLGYTVVRAREYAPEEFYPALAQGDVDMWVNGWFPLHNGFVESDAVSGRIEAVGFLIEAGALQGFLIDKASADELGITSLTDFAEPEISAHFDTDGDGVADLTGCDAGWGCEGVINSILEEQGLVDAITHVQGHYDELIVETIARYESGEPVLFYTWTPNWTVNRLKLGEDVVWITVPGMAATPDVPGCVENPCALGFVPDDIRAVANTEFLENNPAVRELLMQITIPLDDIAAQNQLQADGQESVEAIEGHAAAWIEENRDRVEEWLAAARAAM